MLKIKHFGRAEIVILVYFRGLEIAYLSKDMAKMNGKWTVLDTKRIRKRFFQVLEDK